MEKMIEIYNQINVFGKENGMVLKVIQPGEIEYIMEIKDKHLSSPNIAHGGVVAGLMDSVLGTGALSLAFTLQNLVSTVEFKINYFHPVKLGDILVGKSTVEFHGKSIISTSGEIHCQQTKVLVAKGLGTFNSYPIEKGNLKEILSNEEN